MRRIDPNPYARIHRGLRHSLATATLAAGSVDPSSRDEVAGLVAQVRRVLRQLEAHARHETQFVHPVIAKRLWFLVDELDRQHDDLEVLITRAEAARAAFAAAPSSYFADALYRALCALLAANLAHMDEEEAILPLLRESFTPQELEECQARLVASLTPEERLNSLQTVLPAVAPQERVSLLREVQAGAPAQVFAAILASLDRILGPLQAKVVRNAFAGAAA
jgi:hypothetical protein